MKTVELKILSLVNSRHALKANRRLYKRYRTAGQKIELLTQEVSDSLIAWMTPSIAPVALNNSHNNKNSLKNENRISSPLQIVENGFARTSL